jgi:hypothetical protein
MTSRTKLKKTELFNALKSAINEGIESGLAKNFNPNVHLKSLKDKKKITIKKFHYNETLVSLAL